MNQIPDKTEFTLTIVITLVSGKESVRRCLKALLPQVDFSTAEIIVPFDKWTSDVGELASEFPQVLFHFIEDLGLAAFENITAHQHRLYDRRRAVGLGLASGKIIAMTEDHAVPSADWCQQILTAHQQPYGAIGGAIENGVDNPLNWAWYYCDFGRYGRPFASREVEYISDVNVAYKRDALMSVRDVWCDAYHETSVHWALQERGEKLFLDERLIVYQDRPPLKLKSVLRERIEWGRIFAETRSNAVNNWRRLLFAAGTVFLPLILFVRVFRNMCRQKRTLKQMVSVIPITFLLLTSWSFGEFIGYLNGEPAANKNEIEITQKAKKIQAESIIQ